jgi:hypothetical protein
MPSRKEMPETLKMNKMGKMRQGDVFSFRNNEKLNLALKDKCTITMSSITHTRSKN